MPNTETYQLIEYMTALLRSEERRRCAALGLQPIHFQLLDYLSRCNKYSDTPAAATSFLGLTRGTVSQSIANLEKKAYIKKVQDQADKRKVHLHLLPKGEGILQQAKPTRLLNKAQALLNEESTNLQDNIFAYALTALQKANNSHSFGMCRTCKHFSSKNASFFCQLTQETLSTPDSEKICQEHTPV